MLEKVVVKEIYMNITISVCHILLSTIDCFTLTLKTAVISRVVAEVLSWHTFLGVCGVFAILLGLW